MENFKQSGFHGVVDDTETLDTKSVHEAVTKAQQQAVREVKIRVPAHIPDEVVFSAWQIGMGTFQRVQMGFMVLAYPTTTKGPKGEPVPTIGRTDVLLAKHEDVDRMIGLANIITNVNKELADVSKTNPADMLTASIKAKQIKDEAARHAHAEAQGHSPIILATTLPPRNR